MPIGAAIGPIISGLSALGGGSALAGGLGLGGAALGALGSKGAGKSRSYGTQNVNLTDVTRQEENPLLQPFRSNLLGAFQDELDIARSAPTKLGPEFEASFLNRINETTQAALDKVKQDIAARGGGSFTDEATKLELARSSQFGDFLMQKPILEQQLQALRGDRIDRLLGGGLGFVGQGPQTITNTRTGTTGFDQTGFGGPGFGSALLGNFGGLLGGYAGQQQQLGMLRNLQGLFSPNQGISGIPMNIPTNVPLTSGGLFPWLNQ